MSITQAELSRRAFLLREVGDNRLSSRESMRSRGQSRLSNSSLDTDRVGRGLAWSHMLPPQASLIITLVLAGSPRPGIEARAAVRRSENEPLLPLE